MSWARARPIAIRGPTTRAATLGRRYRGVSLVVRELSGTPEAYFAHHERMAGKVLEALSIGGTATMNQFWAEVLIELLPTDQGGRQESLVLCNDTPGQQAGGHRGESDIVAPSNHAHPSSSC
jgi:hypothetical protein